MRPAKSGDGGYYVEGHYVSAQGVWHESGFPITAIDKVLKSIVLLNHVGMTCMTQCGLGLAWAALEHAAMAAEEVATHSRWGSGHVYPDGQRSQVSN